MLGFSPIAASPIAASARVAQVYSGGADVLIYAIILANGQSKWTLQPKTPEIWTPV